MENLAKTNVYNEQEMTYEQAVQLAKEIERTESALKKMKDMLKEYVEKNGSVNTGEKVWDIYESVSWKFSPNQLKQVAGNIVMEGKNPWQFLNITATNLKKLGWKEEAIAKMGTKTIRRSFKGIKSKK